jgi:hypothetical protein
MKLLRSGLLGTGLLFAGSFLVALLIIVVGGNSSPVAAPEPQASLWPGAQLLHPPAMRAPSTAELPAPVAEDSTDDIPDIATAQVEASMALDPEDRILAIQVLADDSSREGFETLLTTATAGADPRERATAISSLRQRARDAGDEVKIRNAMEAATYDSDPLVVVIAQSALKEFDSEP